MVNTSPAQMVALFTVMVGVAFTDTETIAVLLQVPLAAYTV